MARRASARSLAHPASTRRRANSFQCVVWFTVDGHHGGRKGFISLWLHRAHFFSRKMTLSLDTYATFLYLAPSIVSYDGQ